MSLRLSMLGNLLFALGVALALFFVSNFIADSYVSKNYLSDEKVEARTEEYKNELQSFVNDNRIGIDNISRVKDWADDNNYLYLLIYHGDKLVFESGREIKNDSEMGENKENADDVKQNSVENKGESTTADSSASKGDDNYHSSGLTVETPSRDDLISAAIMGGSYALETADGVLNAYMVDYSEYLYYDTFNILSVILALAGFVVVMWLYFYEITRRVTRLGREVTAVAEGDVNKSITADGEDEITRLCEDVEYMRSSMLENIEKERAALEANRELITAMSHDIRTPLTVLLGYLDIMKLNAPEGDMQQYIEASERTALRLKKMSDDMFGYFLVYGGGIEVAVEECDARTLIDQMLSGHVFLLREQGYDIDFNFEGENNDFLSDVIVVTDPPQLMRIVENIFSNVMKYADKEKPITVYVASEIDELQIKVSNYVHSNIDEAQKNGIGLRSCLKLANAMDVRFSSEEEDGIFTSLMYVPIIPTIEYSDEIEEAEGGFRGWLKSIFASCKSFFAKLWVKIKDFVTRKE